MPVSLRSLRLTLSAALNQHPSSALSDPRFASPLPDAAIETADQFFHRAYLLPLNPDLAAPSLPAATPLTHTNAVRLAPTLLYQGELLDGVPHGRGTLIDTAQQQALYEGAWDHGVFHGEGARYERGKLVQRGVFERGALARGQWVQPSGAILSGTFQGRFLTEGRLLLPSGLWIEGVWKQGQPVGKCVVHAANAIEDLEYDFAHPDENTKFVVLVSEDHVYYDNKYLLYNSAIFLFYFNGDVFIGKVNGREEPVNGIYYYLKNNVYHKLSVGKGFSDARLKDVVYCPLLPIKHFNLVLEEDNQP